MFRRPLLFCVLLSCSGAVFGQASPYVPLDDPVYEDIRAAQIHGLLSDLAPDRLPYTWSEIVSAIGSDSDPRLEAIRAVIPEAALSEGAGFTTRFGVRLTSHGRMDAVRHLPSDDFRPHPFAEAGLHWTRGRVIARAGFRADSYWEYDPDGLDALLRAYMRNDQSYVAFQGDWASAAVGRIATHWGLPGGPGLILSDNARSFDALHFRLGSDRISMQSVIGELDGITGDGRFTGLAGDDSVSSGIERRWMAAHRLDWRPSDRLHISVLEAVLYSGPGTGLSLKYLNPTQFLILAVDNRPKNDENNGMVGVSVTARPARWTLHGQLIFDDFDLEFGQEPASFAAAAEAARPAGADGHLQLSMLAVASRTYNTFQPEGKWLYLKRGLATQFSDFVAGDVRLVHYVRSRGLRVEPYAGFLWQGERDIRDPYRFGDEFPTILTGTVSRTVRAAVRGTMSRGPGYLTLDLGLNRISNRGHLEGRDALLAVGTLSFGLRLDAH